MIWRTEKPTTPGWYWFRYRNDPSEANLVGILQLSSLHGTELIDADDPNSYPLSEALYPTYEWAGPPEPPSE